MQILKPVVDNIKIEDMYEFHRIIESYMFTNKNECLEFMSKLVQSYELYQIITDNYKLKTQIQELKNIINKE